MSHRVSKCATGSSWVRGAVRVTLALGVAASCQLLAPRAQAQTEESVFTYAFRGMGTGVPIGMSASYLLTRDSDWGSEDWRDLGWGAAIGAISGAAGGLAIGLVDLSDGRAGMGAIVLRDTWYGTLLGMTIGAIVGGVRLMGDGSGSDFVTSVAWGAVIGAPVGLGVGFAEAAMRGEMGNSGAPRYANVPPHPNSSTSTWSFSLSPFLTDPSSRRWGMMPTVSGTF